MGDLTMTTWISIREAADRAQLSPKVMYFAAKRGDLRVVRIGSAGRGRSIRTKAAWVDEFLEAAANGGPKAKSAAA